MANDSESWFKMAKDKEEVEKWLDNFGKTMNIDMDQKIYDSLTRANINRAFDAEEKAKPINVEELTDKQLDDLIAKTEPINDNGKIYGSPRGISKSWESSSTRSWASSSTVPITPITDMFEYVSFDEWIKWLKSNPRNIGSQSGNRTLLIKIEGDYIFTSWKGEEWKQKQTVDEWIRVRGTQMATDWDYWKIAYGMPLSIEEIIDGM